MWDRRASAGRRPTLSGGTLALWVAVASLGLLACSPSSRHEVLSFFFDGVPPPGTVEARPPTRSELTTGEAPPWRTDYENPQFYASVHAPYAEGDCGACHAPRPVLVSPPSDQTMCLSCHGQRMVSEGWDHGPLRMGLCSLCHEPHLSALPDLERVSQPAQCTLCHSEPELMTRVPEHRGQAERRCTECHDPHRRGVMVAAEQRR